MRPYKRPISPLWWTKKTNYTLFILRELTSVFIWVYLLFYLEQLSRIAQGTESYLTFRDERSSFGWILFHIVALIAAVYHTVTFFNVSPQAIVVRMGEEKVPPAFIVGPQYAAWLTISGVIAWIVLRS
jgi:fumarate reductase subunit C